MEKKQISGLVSILISAAIAIAALWGYNIVVVQPMAEQVAEQSSAWQNTADPSPGSGQVLYGTEAQGGDRAVGDSNFTNLVASGDVSVGGALKVGATPVALQVGALAGKAIICGSTTITGTGTHSARAGDAVLCDVGAGAGRDGQRRSLVVCECVRHGDGEGMEQRPDSGCGDDAGRGELVCERDTVGRLTEGRCAVGSVTGSPPGYGCAAGSLHPPTLVGSADRGAP